MPHSIRPTVAFREKGIEPIQSALLHNKGGRSGASVQSMSTSECIGSVGFSHVVRSLGHGGRVIAVAVSRQLDDIPAMTAVDATRELGVTRGRITQLFRRDRFALRESLSRGDSARGV